MSRKWQHVKRWDDENLTGVLTPVRLVLRTFSSITLAVCLLVFVAVYAVLASVPVGLLALAPTYLFYAITLAAAVLVVALVPTLGVRRLMRGAGRGARFAVTMLMLVVLGVVGAALWRSLVWPTLSYVPTTGAGVRFFPAFVEVYGATTLRRLPGFEMTEQQFYAWWPLKLALLLFVTNMICATLRRIEFCFKNLGVLTVHTGIVLISLGSLFYGRLKQEGDTLLMAPNTPTQDAGMPQVAFYDRERPVLFVTQTHDLGALRRPGHTPWEQRRLDRLPRYNDYNLDAGVGDTDSTLWAIRGIDDAWSGGPDRDLSQRVPAWRAPTSYVDTDISFRVVGYAAYAQAQRDVVRVDLRADDPISPGFEANPVRFVELYSELPDEHGHAAPGDRPAFNFALFPRDPASRTSDNGDFGVEYTMGMDETRWRDLASPLRTQAEHALVIEVPRDNAPAYREVVAIVPGVRRVISDTGFAVRVKEILPEPPFPIITEGYQGATSMVAVIEVEHVATQPLEQATTYDRWVYHRFPEISQDLLAQTDPATGRPIRRDADPEIRLSLIDCSQLNVYFDERPDGRVRAIVRQGRGAVRVIDDVGPSARVEDIVPMIDLALAQRWDHGRPFERPVPVPLAERKKDQIGTHDQAMMAVEISASGESRVIWLPFKRFAFLDPDPGEIVTLRDGRRLRLAFGRMQHLFPGFALRLVDFEMIAYDHRGAPRDYQSIVRVEPSDVLGAPADFDTYEHVTKLNAPLRAPFHWDEDATWLRNFTSRMLGGLNPRQFKLSQAGWDQTGWTQSQELVDQGMLDRPRARWTILGVGNNPGIHVVALGGIMMGVGIPWAFYVKPWLLRREKRKLASGASARAVRTNKKSDESPAPEPVGAGA